MEPTAVSQVVEQLVRVSVIVCSAFAFRKLGWTVYQTGTAAMSGAVFGGLCAYGILHYYEQKDSWRSIKLPPVPIIQTATKIFDPALSSGRRSGFDL